MGAPTIVRGGSRIHHRRGRQPSGGPTYDFAKFGEKLYEIEKILGRRGARAGVAPLNPPLLLILTNLLQQIGKKMEWGRPSASLDLSMPAYLCLCV